MDNTHGSSSSLSSTHDEAADLSSSVQPDLPKLSSRMLLKLERKDRVFDKKLIELIKKRRIIYDLICPPRFTKTFKTALKTSWISVGKIMKTSVKGVQQRWLKIRRDYMEDKLEGRNEYDRKSPYHDQLQFLDRYILDSIEWAKDSEDSVMLQYFLDETSYEEYCNYNYLFNDPLITTFEEFIEFAHQFLRIPLHPEVLRHNLNADIRTNNHELKELLEQFKYDWIMKTEHRCEHILKRRRKL